MYEIEQILGLILTDIQKGDNEITFTAEDGSVFKMYHMQDCCESVYVEDVCGDLDDLIGTVILTAEERTKDDAEDEYGIGCWTFYELATIKGSVTIRWYGSSNGYYGVGVSFEKVN